MTRKSLCLALLLLIAGQAFGQTQELLVRDIRIVGNQRISEGTVFNYLPINVGDRIDQQRVQEAMRALYDTSLFDDIELRADGETLIVVVQERPSIAGFTISGNKSIETEDMEGELRRVGLAEGKTFDQSVLDGVQAAMTNQFYDMGKYGVTVEVEVSDVGQNQVQISIIIVEGERATIRQINIVGNEAFTDKELLKQMSLRQPHLTCFIKSDCRYSKEALLGDIEALSSYFLDRGYINFDVSSTQVAISPDLNNMFVTLNVEEGDLYTIGEVQLAGDTVLREEQLMPLLLTKSGQTYSQKMVTQSVELISYAIGEQGYALVQINPVPSINEDDKTVDLTYYVDPGNRVYVRRVSFYGTHSTDDYVFRREMRQLEGSWLSDSAVERSTQRIRRLPFVETVDSDNRRVAGSDDLMDVDFTIKEGLPGSFGGGLGYSDAQGAIFTGNFVHTNFMGTGNRVSMDLATGKYSTLYALSHTDPYATPDGVSRTVAASYRDITQFTNGASDFDTKSTTVSLEYGFPISEYQLVRAGFAVGDSELSSNSQNTFQSQQWVLNNGNPSIFSASGILFEKTRYTTYELILGWTYDSRNRVLFADRGSQHRVNLAYTLPFSEVEYYFLNYDFQKYFPISGQWIFSINTELGYGDDIGDTTSIPPFRNYFAGGPNSVRGFKENWLGPRDTFGNPYGGNMLVGGQFELLVPVPEIARGKARLSLFYDIGNVFSTGGVSFFDKLGDPIEYDWDPSQLRQSVGVAIEWLAPIGMFKFSYGVALNAETETIRFYGDETENLQFSIGSAF